MARGSELTADTKRRQLMGFCEEMEITPDKLAQMNVKDLEKLLNKYVDKKSAIINPKTGNHYAGSYIHSRIKGVKSWLAFNDKQVKKIPVSGATLRPTLENENVPSQVEMKRILMVASIREKVSCSLVAFSGFRIEVLGAYKGRDGLKVKDFPEIIIDNNAGKVTFSAMPTRIIVREEISKAGHQYTTFLCEEGCDYLKAYLEYRMGKGEILTKASEIIKPKMKNWSEPHVTTGSISIGIRKAFQKAGLTERPYSLRCYFDTQMLLAESKGKIPNSYREYWCGHTGDMSARYTTNRNKLAGELIESMRNAYKNAYPFIQTINTGISEGEQSLKTYKDLVMVIPGISQTQRNELEGKGIEEYQAFISQMLDSRQGGPSQVNGNGKSKKKRAIVDPADWPKYFLDGWLKVEVLDNGKYAIETEG
jgi:hypothetical protein